MINKATLRKKTQRNRLAHRSHMTKLEASIYDLLKDFNSKEIYQVTKLNSSKKNLKHQVKRKTFRRRNFKTQAKMRLTEN